MNAQQTEFIALDHLVVAATTLAQGADYLHEKFGLDLEGGGRHEGYGTHNRLLSISGGTYLELIAPDPDQPEPARARPFGLDDPAMIERLAVRPRLVHYILRTDSIARAAAALGYDPGPGNPMTRGALSWRVTINAHPSGAASNPWPAMIEWGRHPSPGMTLPVRGVELQRFHIRGSAELVSKLSPLTADPRIMLRENRFPMLAAEFQTPVGWAILD